MITDRRYRILFESSADAIMLLDADHFFDCNKATLDMFGLTKEQFIRLHPSEISPPVQPNGMNSREDADLKIAEAFAKGVNRFEWVHCRSNGEEFTCTVWLTAFPLEGRRVLQATVRESTVQAEASMDLEAHRLKLQMLLEEKIIALKKELDDRKKAETEVRRLIKAVETSFNAVALFDMDMNLLYANHAFCRLANIEERQIQSKTAYDFLDSQSLSVIKENIEAFMDGVEIELIEIKAHTLDSRELWIQVAGSIIFNEAGDPEGLLAIINDITENKKMLDALKESEAKFKTMVEKSADGVVILQDGKIVYMNPSLATLSGYSLDEQLGRDFTENLVPEEKKKVKEAYLARLNGKAIPPIYDTVIMRKDGKRVPIEINATIMEYNGAPADFVYIRDLSERKHSMDEIRLAKERLEYILGATNTGYDIIDPDFNVVYVDPTWSRTLGDYRGKKCYDYFMGFKGPCDGCGIQKALKTKKTIVTEEYLEKEGRCIEVHTIPFQTDEGNWLVAEFNLDITERKKIQKTLEDSESRYRELANGISSGLAVYRTDDNGKTFKFVDFNRSAEKIEGLKKSKVIGRNVTEVFPGIKEMGLLDVFKRVWKTGHSEHFPISLYKDKQITGWRENYVYKLPSGEIASVYDDVTERKIAEEALHNFSNQLKSISENLADGMVYQINSGRDGKKREMSYLSPAVRKLHGLRIDDVLKNPGLLYSQVLEPDRTRLAKTESKCFASKTKMDIEVRVKLPSGEIRWRHFLSVPRTLSNKDIVWDGIEIDITDRKIAEEKLRENEEKYRTLMERANDAIFIADAKTGILLDVNEKAVELTGIARKNLIGMHQGKLHPAEEIKRYEKIFRNHVKSGRAIEENLYVVHKDGHRIPVSISASIFEIGGRTVNQGIFHDLTERFKAEKAVKEADEKVRSLFASMEDLVFGFNSEGVFISCHSPASGKLYMPSEIFIGKKHSEILPPNVSGMIEIGLKRNRKNQSYDFEYPLEIQGQETWFSAKMSPVFLDGQFNGSVAVVRDITRKKSIEKALQTSEQVYRGLYESTMALGDLSDLTRIMEVIAEQARNMLDGECSTIYLWSEE
ncbi:MAG: PAS domain S-box protein, partial [Thermoplasmata archaeon]|nr:PAS domain S-box protein [Thermoplasmata archaeon]